MDQYELDQHEYKFEIKVIEEYHKLPIFKTPFVYLNHALNGGIFDQSLIVLAGDTGIGKSTLAMQIITNFWSTYNCMTFVYSGELPPAAVMEVTYGQLKVNTPVLPNIYGRSYGDINDIEKSLNKFKPRFILIDNLMCLACGTGDINQLQSNAINKCREWAIKYNAIVLLVVHTNKNSRDQNSGKLTINSICGSSNIANQASLILALNKIDDDTRSLAILKNRKTGKLCEMILKYDDDRKVYKQIVGEI